ncbi:MAG: hypothetical protein JO131_06675, partial [Gammaproteobacteria bacterium]|nr:hypothetical protein [Gammaproteobacteria bacterium]
SAAEKILQDKKRGILENIDQIKARGNNDEIKPGALARAYKVPQIILDNFEEQQEAHKAKIELLKEIFKTEANLIFLHEKLSGIFRGVRVNGIRIPEGLGKICNVHLSDTKNTCQSKLNSIVIESKKRLALNDPDSPFKKHSHTLFGARDEAVVTPLYKILAEIDILPAEEIKTRLRAINLVIPNDEVHLSHRLESK